MLREVVPRNARTRRILKAREPQLIESPKQTLLLHGPKCPLPLHTVLKTIHSLTKPHSVLFHKKNENIHPFENTESLEFLATKNECGIAIYGSSNKKRPNCITILRIFDSKVLDMCELLLLGTQAEMEAEAAAARKNATSAFQLNVGVGMKPMILFSGTVWADETSGVFTMLKSMFLDIFKGEETDKIDVEGLQYLLMIAAEEPQDSGIAGVNGSATAGSSLPVIHLRWYKIRTRRSGHKLPRVELEEVGPKLDFRIGRAREADEDAMKTAMKQGKRPQDMEKTKKNIGMDSIGDKIGRVHLGRQDLSDLQTRKMKGLKRRAGIDDDEDDDEEGGMDLMEVDEISEDEDNGRKRSKRE
ncbi:rRNA-binding ribosome biosynthesis protein rpf2 [Microsporum canis]|uniref:Ribosome production factor 2 homolog n=1 Tax=Arthroderma otae (strain ATCC MYA-4605 / CBS 113480) TaxID=554155 RepID=C5FZ05_ARTOC|nr:ribosome biogenesis protein RPF2 [Microsporum canis CBS 113480]EEQ34753.1 ribosome biogenesis protein RPF2 [Microsporum canis CBS 113480]